MMRVIGFAAILFALAIGLVVIAFVRDRKHHNRMKVQPLIRSHLNRDIIGDGAVIGDWAVPREERATFSALLRRDEEPRGA